MIRRLLKFALWTVLVVVSVIVVSAGVAVTAIETQCRPPEGMRTAAHEPLVADVNYARTEANTYWTFPEWYIVYAYEDYGAFLDAGTPSAFPWYGQIAGFWQALCRVNQEASALPGDHSEYKRMVYVIGLSFTYEFGIKGMYENTIGRVSEWLRGPHEAETDIFEAAVAQEYGAFLNQVPWYEFPFMDKVKLLWSKTPLVSESMVRDVERHFALSAEYLAKAGYAKVIAAALAATADPAERTIRLVVSPEAKNVIAGEADVRIVRELGNGDVLLDAPRYRQLTHLLQRLARDGVDVREIAGNRTILMTAVRPEGESVPIDGMEQLFSFSMSGKPGFRRDGYRVDVQQLSAVLRASEAAGVEVEHLYDY